MTIAIETQGRRHYLRGNTFAIKDTLRAAGAKWDPEAKAWWTGKRETAEQFVGPSAGNPTPASPTSDRGDSQPTVGQDTIVAARATYKGSAYYVVGRVVRGRTHWDDRVSAVETRDGAKVLLSFRDGSKSFWAARADVQVSNSYDRPQTIGRLSRFAEKAKSFGTEDCRCSCHREQGAGTPGTTLYDGCDRCGCESCG